MLIGYHNIPGVLIVYYQKPSDLWHSCATNARLEKRTEGQHHIFFDMYSTWSKFFPTLSVNMNKIDPALFLILIILLCRKPLRKPKKCCLWSSNPPWRPRWRKVGEIGKSNNHSKTWERLLVIQSDFYQLWNAQFSSIRSQDLRVLVITHGDVWLCACKQLYDRPRKQRDLQWRLKRRNFLKEKRKSPLSYRNSSNWTGKTISIPYLSITLYEYRHVHVYVQLEHYSGEVYALW